MEVKASLNYLRIAPRKVRQVADLVRGKKTEEARTILEFAIKRGANPVLKLLNSAVASAKHDFHLQESNLFVSQIMVNEGPTLKRWHPMSRGRAYPIMKRSSHIILILKDNSVVEEKKVEAAKIEDKPKTEKKIKKTVKSAKIETKKTEKPKRTRKTAVKK